MRTLRAGVPIAAVLLFGSATSVLAQERSLLRLLPTDDRQLRVGSEVQGALSASDYRSHTDSYLEAWAIEGSPGQAVTVDLMSDDFDPVLYVAGPGLPSTLVDDDSGGACNSRISFTFLETGVFHVVASANLSETTGTFTLRVSETAPPGPTYGCGELDPATLMALPTEGRVLAVGETVTGSLNVGSPTVRDGQPIVAWELSGMAGESLIITMVSDDFDSFLFGYGPGMSGAMIDDDSAGDLNAQLSLTLVESGTFVIGASALSGGAVGSYSLTVERAPGLMDLPVSGALEGPGSVDGFLSVSDPLFEGRRSHVWTLTVVETGPVTIEMISDEFDSFLSLVGPGLAVPLTDDDSAGELNARLSVTLPETGTYRIIASSLGTDGGSYQLTIR